jgi:transcriptional regulator with XRE-family HTH domain
MAKRRSGTGSDVPEGGRLVVGQNLPDTEKLGALARAARLDVGLSAQELAEKVDVSASYVRAIERGDRAPAPAVARALFAELGFGVEDAGDGADLVLSLGDREWQVDFKHWANTEGAGTTRTGVGELFLQLRRYLAETDALSTGDRASATPTDDRTDARHTATPTTAGSPAFTALLSGLVTRSTEADPTVGADAHIGRIVRHVARLDHEALELVADLIVQLSAGIDPDARRAFRRAVDAVLDAHAALATVQAATPDSTSAPTPKAVQPYVKRSTDLAVPIDMSARDKDQ